MADSPLIAGMAPASGAGGTSVPASGKGGTSNAGSSALISGIVPAGGTATVAPKGADASTTPSALVASTPPPKDTSSLFSGFTSFLSKSAGKISDAISNAIAPPDPLTVGKNPSAIGRTLDYLPSELARQIPGVAELQDDSAAITESPVAPNILPGIQAQESALTASKKELDAEQTSIDPSDRASVAAFNAKIDAYNTKLGIYQKSVDVYNKAAQEDVSKNRTGYGGVAKYVTGDVAVHAIPGALTTVAKGFVTAPVKAVADIYDAGRVLIGKNPNASFTLPVLGKVTSDVFDVVDAIQNGTDPMTAVLNAASSSIFNVLFFADIVNRVAAPRSVKVLQTEGNLPEGSATVPGPKTGRLYEQPTAYNRGGAQVLPPEALAKMKEQGITLGKNFDPKQPVFFKTTLGKGGTYTGEMYQVKPSYLMSAYEKVFGTKVPTETLPALLGQTPSVPASALANSELRTAIENAPASETSSLHSQTVAGSDLVDATNSAIEKHAPETAPAISKPAPLPPSHSVTVAHNALRLLGGDTEKASEGADLLKKDIESSIAEHGTEITHAALMENVGVDASTAARLIQEVSTGKEIDPQEVLDGIKTPEKVSPLVSSIEPAPKEEFIHHSSADGTLSLDENNNINFGTEKKEVAQFAGEDGKTFSVSLKGLKVKDFPTKEEMFDAAGKDKQKYLDEGIDVVRADNHAIGINSAKIEEISKIPVKANFLDKTIEAEPLVPATTPDKPFNTTDVAGNPLEQILARTATKLEEKSPTARSRGFNSVPDKAGYEKVYKPYGEHGAGFYYSKGINPNRGFISLDPLARAVDNVTAFVESSERTTKITGDFTEAIYKHEGSRKANRQRAIHLLQNVGHELTAEEWENVYHHDEDSKVVLSDKESAIYNGVIVPLKAALKNARAEYRELGGVITRDLQEEATPRYPKEKNGPIDKLLKHSIVKKTTEAIRNGGLLSKSVGSGAKHRVFHIATDEHGNRTVVSIKAKRVIAFKNGVLTDLGDINFQRRDQLLKEEVAPIRKKIKSVQKLIDTLESIKTRDPVSSQKLETLQTRIEALKQFATEREVQIKGMSKVHATVESDIKEANARATQLETRLRALKPFGNIPRVAKAIGQLQQDIDAAYVRETNLSLSDVYENLSEFAKRNESVSNKLIQAVAKTTNEFKILSKIPKGSDVALTEDRIANAIDKLRELSNDMAEVEAKYDPAQLDDRVFKGSDEKAYTIGQATTKEIEANTKTRYHKNALANYVLAYDQTSNALSSLKLLELIKDSDESEEVIIKQNQDHAAPEGWKDLTGVLPQFRDYYAEPKLYEALQDLAERLQGREEFPVFDEINNFLTAAIVLNPIMHLPNVAMGWATSEAGTGKVPGLSASSRANFARAVNEVKNAGPLYLHYLEHGAPFMALKNTAQEFTDAVLTQYTEEVKENPNEHEALAKVLGYANPLAMARGFSKLNEHITWGGNDIMFMHALLDYADSTGSTPEAAVKAVSKRMADYRLPSRIGPGKFGRLVSRVAQSKILLFARYRFSGTIKPWIENVKDSARPGSSTADRLAGIRSLAFLGLMAFLVYPYINKMLKGLTGNPLTYISYAGATKPIENIEKLNAAGVSGIPAFVGSVFTLSPAITAIIELGYNIDTFTKNPIYGPLPAEGFGHFAVSMVAPLASATRMTPGDFALSLFGIYTPKSSPGKVALERQKYDELPMLEAQVKKDLAAGLTDKANDEMRDFNDRAIANYNSAMLQTNGKPLAPDGSQNADFLKEWGIKVPGKLAVSNASALYGNGSLTSKSGLLDRVVTYAKAIGTDPATAFSRIFTGQAIIRVDNAGFFSSDSAVIVARLPLASSEAVRAKDAAAQGLTKDQMDGLQLDHFVPLEAGGTNQEYNLDLVTTEQNLKLHNDVETPIAAALKNGQISRAKALEYLTRYKIGTLGESPNQYYLDLYKNKYGSKPITAAEVVAEINSGKAK